jgi:hypothetical protein
VSKIVIEMTTTGVVLFLVVNFTTAAELRVRIVDFATTVYRKKDTSHEQFRVRTLSKKPERQ